MNWSIRARRGSLAVLGAGLIVAAGCEDVPETDAVSVDEAGFQADPYWPQPLPEDWILGQVSGLSVDDRDHVWIVHRPGTVQAVNAGAAQDPPVAMCCTPAPPVIQFAPDG